MTLVRTAFCGLLVAFLVGSFSFANDKADQSSANLLALAASLQNIRESGSQPFQLRMRIHAERIVAKPMDGAYAEVWMSPDKWRREIAFPGFSQLETGDVDSKWLSRNLDFRPRVVALTAIAIENFSRPQILQGEAIKSVRPKKVRGIEIGCVEITGKDGKQDRELCFDSSGVMVNESFREQRFEYSDFGKFGGKLFPKSIRVYESDNKVLDIIADGLSSPANLRTELFHHTATAQRMAACERWPAELAKKVTPQYPPAARRAHEQGTVILYVLLASQGTVEKTIVLQSAGSSLDQSATEAVRQWVYSPSSCGSTSLSSEIEVQVNYELRVE